MTSNSLLSSLFAQKSWANNDLFNLLATLTQPEHAPVLASAIRTLNHIYVVDQIFKAHLCAEAHGYAATNTDPLPELGELQFSVAQADAWYLEYAASVTPAELARRISFRFTDGDSGCMSQEEMLFHVLTHGSYHRGNVGQMLKSIQVAPPRDLLTKFLHLQEPERRQA